MRRLPSHRIAEEKHTRGFKVRRFCRVETGLRSQKIHGPLGATAVHYSVSLISKQKSLCAPCARGGEALGEVAVFR
jgi:hypothetical protein